MFLIIHSYLFLKGIKGLFYYAQFVNSFVIGFAFFKEDFSDHFDFIYKMSYKEYSKIFPVEFLLNLVKKQINFSVEISLDSFIDGLLGFRVPISWSNLKFFICELFFLDKLLAVT